MAYLLQLLSITFLSAALPVDDVNFECTSKNIAQKYFNDFNVNVSSFGGMELCNASVDTKKLLNDFELVEQGEFGAGATNIFIQNAVDQDSYYPWLKSMTRSIRRKNDIPHATAYNQWGNFTMQDGWAQLSTLGRVGVLIHEARHTAGYGHTRCSQGPYKNANTSGCDRSLGQKGSHGVEMEYYSRVVLKGQNFHPVYKTMARLMTMARANFVFNDMPMKKREALLTLTSNGALMFEGSIKKIIEAPQLPVSYVLKRTSSGASLFDGEYSYAIDVYKSFHQAELIEDVYSYYKILNIHNINDLVDLEEFDVNGQRYLVALDGQNRVYSFNFPKGKWGRAKTISGAERLITTSPMGREGLFVIKSDSTICQLNPKNMSCVADGSLWPEKALSFINYNGNFYELRTNGVLYKANSKDIAPDFKGIAVQQAVRVPLYDQYEL